MWGLVGYHKRLRARIFPPACFRKNQEFLATLPETPLETTDVFFSDGNSFSEKEKKHERLATIAKIQRMIYGPLFSRRKMLRARIFSQQKVQHFREGPYPS